LKIRDKNLIKTDTSHKTCIS